MPCRPAICSMSLGRACAHKLPQKLDMAQKYGFQGIELFYEDLEYFAREKHGDTLPTALLAAASDIRELCSIRDLTILCLQPFMHFGALVDCTARKQQFETMRLWFQIANALGTNMIQLPSSFLPAEQLDPSLSVLVADMAELADLGASHVPPLKFAYEALAWGTHIDTWEQSWEIVKLVDRPNFGLCLDTFNIAGRIYADPASVSPSRTNVNADAMVTSSMCRLRETLDPSKIFFVEVVDAERLDEQLTKGHKYYSADQPARMSWSRNCRCFYREEKRGAYLPIKEVATAILDKVDGLGFSGWVSMELFSRTTFETAPEIPEEHAKRGMAAWATLKSDVRMDIGK